MDDEKLINCVRDHPVLYDTSNPKYMDAKYKMEVWREIAEELRQPAINCKSRWQNIRDQLRKSWAKKATKSKMRKYKYEDILSFLIPYFVERTDTSSIDPLDYEVLFDDSNEDNEFDEVKPDILGATRKRKCQEPSPATLAKYVCVKGEEPTEADPHPIDAFLSGLSATIKSFSPYYQHLAKGRLFAVVHEMELEQLRKTSEDAGSAVSEPTSPSSL